MNLIKQSKTAMNSRQFFFKNLFWQIEEASSIVHYSLLLPKIPISLSKNDAGFTESIEQISTTVYQNCSYLLNDFNYNVFGYKEFDCSDLSLLSMHSGFWSHVFKQDMILSTFDKLRKIIAESVPVNNYQMTRFSNFTSSGNGYDSIHHGFDYLTGKGKSTNKNYISLQLSKSKDYLNISPNRKEIYLNSKNAHEEEASKTASSQAPNYKRRVDTLLNKLGEAGFSLTPLSLQLNSYSKSSSLYKMNFLEFFQYTVSYKSSKNNKYEPSSILPILGAHNSTSFSTPKYKNYKESMYQLLSNVSLEVIDKNIQPRKKAIAHKLLLSDKIHLRYQIEKIFSPILIDCMYQNTINARDMVDTKDTIKTKDMKHPLENSLDLIASCVLLPNVFTRHYLLQMCFDTICKHFDYAFKDSYFFTRFKESPRAIATYAQNEELSSLIKTQMLIEKYYEFINYLGRFLFPLIENYFFCTLWENYSVAYPNATPAEIVLNMYFQIRKYLNTEEIAHRLLNTEDVMLSFKFQKPKLTSDDIIKPDFSTASNNKPDVKLYHECIKACSTKQLEPPIPDFISLDYFNQIIDTPSTHVQALYAKSIKK